MSSTAEALSPERSPADALAQRVVDAALGTVDILSIYLGDRLGWYRSLDVDGPATADELAARTGTNSRYTREWLEQQAVTGLLDVADGEHPSFALSRAGAEVFADEHSLAYLAPLARLLCGAAKRLPELLEAYRSGGGVGWARYGRDARDGQADMNRPWYEHSLADALGSIPEVDRLLRAPGSMLADLGCGGGWSTIALARAYPEATVRGVDIDRATVELARANVAAAPEVAVRVTVTEADAAALPRGGYQAVFAFECVHDMPRPVEVLAAARRALAPGGVMIVMDEAVADTFAAPGDETERLMYGFSLTVCLPDGMAHPASVATGTVMRADTLRRYAEAAGFAEFEVLPIEDFGFWRFYLLRE
ncbi:class I SAM-dependent methyltransferase [Tomitella biformata]|uniref:class I SAM-dependent methyltransferase n=1 Tax=Tomitella biformata TaxID=630403 RepID=UPI00046544D1|nr:class I SAM-dependent methyltransferase [Tomitella biformata]